jgi:integral membrane protein
MQFQLRFLRITGITEGISFLVLLLIAMPVKYYLGMPMMVKVVGWLHGGLFILYIFAVIAARKLMGWNLWSLAVALAASLIPIGTFLLDKSIRKREQELLISAVSDPMSGK